MSEETYHWVRIGDHWLVAERLSNGDFAVPGTVVSFPAGDFSEIRDALASPTPFHERGED